jgi:hypothetical protein
MRYWEPTESWGLRMVTQILWAVFYSASLAGALLAAVQRPHRAAVAVVGALVAAVSAVGWSFIVRAMHQVSTFTEVPRLFVFPVVWEDLGSGVLGLGLALLMFAVGPLRTVPVRLLFPPALVPAGSALVTYIYVF